MLGLIVDIMISFSGCTVYVIRKGLFYSAVKTNETLIDLYVKIATALKVPFDDSLRDMVTSTDMGNVSQIKPSIYPLLQIPTKGANHTHAFTKAADNQEVQLATLNSASMAITAIGSICNPKLLANVKQNFNKK